MLAAVAVFVSTSGAQSLPAPRPDDPSVKYASAPLANPIERLNARLDAGSAHLQFQRRNGYLRSAIEAIGLRVDSQMLVFSDASFQARHITAENPRAIFFKDDVALGWVRDGDVIEIAAQDERLGAVFYTLDQKNVAAPRFKRAMVCLGCHLTGGTRDVPGLVLFSSTEGAGRPFGSVSYMNQATPMAERFGGWFVTGAQLPRDHRGNAIEALGNRSRALTSTTGLFDSDGYLASTSDIAALLVFAHQAQTLNLLTRAAWEARVADRTVHGGMPGGRGSASSATQEAAGAVVDSMLFINEAPFDVAIRGSSGFAERFAAEGPRDSHGRSLRELDLTRRLMRYPCSYLIYSPVFDALPPSVKGMIYERLWQILSGAEHGARYRRALTLDDRRAVVEILRDTKPGLPSFFAGRVV
ncbi:MAG TPA: hypothetical protein VGH34_11630 [Vicinamibacterales bacterium]